VVGWYGGSEVYALISSLRYSRETFHRHWLQAPISVTPSINVRRTAKWSLMQYRRVIHRHGVQIGLWAAVAPTH
jgi:hypothetical protein